VLGNGRLRLPKIGDIEVRWSRELPAAPTSVTLTRDAAGRYFASFVVEVGERPLPATAAECGIDLGLSHFAVLDDGTKVAAPKFLRRAEKKLKKARTRADPAGQVGARRRMAGVREHAGVQGETVRPGFSEGRPAGADVAGVLGMRSQRRP
jgi:putative transposase